ncbi:MAG: hypothetical protein FVQ77_10440 [Cytophagales bacterium]|nr:hypothetical protein [Cytophagales bacterium]
MKFRIYDILSHLIPGFLIYIAVLYTLGRSFDPKFVVPATAIAFFVGYFVNTIASWLEDFYNWTWCGKPSNKLLEGKDIWKVRFYHSNDAKRLLIEEAGKKTPSNDELFSIAMRYAHNSNNQSVHDFNANYAFSRAILTTVLIFIVIVLPKHFQEPFAYCLFIPTLIIVWLRAKQRGYYYAREVLSTYLKIKKESN